MLTCDLSGCEFSQADLSGGRLHGSKIEGLRGVVSLKGVTIGSTQVVPLALQMLGANSVTVDDAEGDDE